MAFYDDLYDDYDLYDDDFHDDHDDFLDDDIDDDDDDGSCIDKGATIVSPPPHNWRDQPIYRREPQHNDTMIHDAVIHKDTKHTGQFVRIHYIELLNDRVIHNE